MVKPMLQSTIFIPMLQSTMFTIMFYSLMNGEEFVVLKDTCTKYLLTNNNNKISVLN